MLDVVTVWAPRPENEKWRPDYLELLKLQAQTVRRVGHRHVVVTDAELPGYKTLQAELPRSLMHAILAGQLAWLRQWPANQRAVLVDIDVLVCRDLRGAFNGTWDIGLTRRDNPVAPIQNGAMYFDSGCKTAAIALFERALELCGEHWGGDQEALSQAVAPVRPVGSVAQHFGARIGFLSTETHNFGVKNGAPKMHPSRFCLHFKGEAKAYAARTVRQHGLVFA